jgi:hypothetical protein
MLVPDMFGFVVFSQQAKVKLIDAPTFRIRRPQMQPLLRSRPSKRVAHSHAPIKSVSNPATGQPAAQRSTLIFKYKSSAALVNIA